MQIIAFAESMESSITQKTTEQYVEESQSITQSTAAVEVTPSSETRFRLAALPAPEINVSDLCVCDLLVAQCDINCCCDSDCSASDFGTFTSCSIETVIDDSRLCRQQAAMYSINVMVNPPQRVLTLTEQSNPNVFCIQKANYNAGLAFVSPDVSSSGNFNDLVKQFGGFSFSAATEVQEQATTISSRYQYGVPVETTLKNREYLKLPALHSASQCTDNNPAGFLINQAVHCSRNLTVENCTADAALNMATYHSFAIFSAPSINSTVGITIQSITLQSLNGTRTRVNNGEEFSPDVNINLTVCSNVVLEVLYVISYNESGHITNASVSFVLGTLEKSMIPVQQSFRISFVEENKTQIPVSGNPGYVVGLPLVAGFKPPGSGIIHSTNQYGQLTLLKSSPSQDCFSISGSRMPVLFGYNMVSGCKLRITNTTDCTILSKIILDIFKGQNFPEYVASFGNAKVQNVDDWVQIADTFVNQGTCSLLPVSLDIVVRWTKYGSLVNPQAKIQRVTMNISTIPFSMPTTAEEIKMLQLSNSVTFIDVSASAGPGYRAQPTLDAKLPYDFFYPFV